MSTPVVAPCYVRGTETDAPTSPDLRTALADAVAGWGERGEGTFDSGLAYADGEPVEIHLRKRLHRYALSDRGRAVAKAGRPPGWREAAELAVEPMNLGRNGEVFVGAVEGRDLASLLVRLADSSRAVLDAVLAVDD